MALRYMVVPVESGTEDGSDATLAKYWDAPGITGCSKVVVDFSADQWNDLPWHPETMCVVRFHGTEDALDAVAANDDAYGKQEYGISDQEVADYLNDKFDRDDTFQEWVERAGISDDHV